MLKAKTRWQLQQEEPLRTAQAHEMAKQLSIPVLVAKLLVNRGITSSEQAAAFLYGGEKPWHDPMLLLGMKEAVARLELAKGRSEHIRIYGDYDADGVSSTSFMIRLLGQLGFSFDYYIPHRHHEGYGLNTAAIDRASADGVSLIVTVDTGISAVDQIAHASKLNIDVIVTDHHEPPQLLPAAHAIINPKQTGCMYPFKGLAGVGVAFKLGHALLGRAPLEWAELAALGTIADIMPLTGENRNIVRYGLQQMQAGGCVGLRALAEAAGVEAQSMKASQVAFALAPRINASGRMSHADDAVQLLTTNDPDEAAAKAIRLDLLNKERQQVVAEIVTEAELQWQQRLQEAQVKPSVIVVAAEGWNVGVIGIVASKLIEKYYRPAIVLGIDPETGLCKGSARSIEGFDLYAALSETADLLQHYGGHQAAAGMTVHRDHLPQLEARLGAIAQARLSEEQWIPHTAVEVECSLDEADVSTIEQLALLEPFGAGNPSPKFLLRKLEVEEIRAIGKQSDHLRLTLRSSGKRIEAIRFGAGELASSVAAGSLADLVGELAINEWNGSRKAQLMLSDWSVGHVQLFDYRNAADSEQALHGRLKQIAAQARERCTVILGNQALPALELAAAAEAEIRSGKTGSQVVWMSYEQLRLRPGGIDCHELILLDCPPSAGMLAAILQGCEGLHAVSAIYHADRKRRAGFPAREQFGEVYQALKRMPQQDRTLEQLTDSLHGAIGWSKDVIAMMLQVFLELAFIEIKQGKVIINTQPVKRPLTESVVYMEAMQQAQEDKVLLAGTTELAAWVMKQTATWPDKVIEGAV